MHRQVWILAEPEGFYLPELVAALAQENLVAGIVEIHFRESFLKKLKKIKNLLKTFGIYTFLKIGCSALILKLFGARLNRRFLILKSVATRFGIDFYDVYGFDDPQLKTFLETKIKDQPIFIQVSKRVPQRIVENYFCLNKHSSLLPEYAGIYPVFWSILHKRELQGVTLHRMDAEFDRGVVLAQQSIPNEGTFFEVYGKLYEMTSRLLIQLLKHPSPLSSLKVDVDWSKYSYFSYPTASDRKKFISMGGRFGSPALKRAIHK